MHSPARGGVGRATRGLGLKDEEARDGGGTPGKGSVEGKAGEQQSSLKLCRSLEPARLQAGRKSRAEPQGQGEPPPHPELGNYRWQSKINLFFITSCQTEPVSSAFLVTVNIDEP